MFDFLKNIFGGGHSQRPQPTQAPSPAGPVPIPTPTPAPAPAQAGSGGVSSLGLQGPAGMTPDQIDRMHGFYTSGFAGTREKDPRLLELQADRAKAQQELASRFQIVDPKAAAGGNLLPNQVTREQFEQLSRTYSDIRMGESNLKLDSAGMDPVAAKAFQDGSMNDIASMLQTGAGRDLVGQLSKGVGGDGKTHTTSIRGVSPLEASAEALDPNKENQRWSGPGGHGQGADMIASYAPGVDLQAGDPAKNPFMPMRSDGVLFHELTHALHGIQGTSVPGMPAGMMSHDSPMSSPFLAEEYATVGLGAHANDKITENAYRAERRQLAGQVGARAGDELPAMSPRTRYSVMA